MRPPTVDDEQLLDSMGRVISRHGVDGASLALLSEAAGLKRASLYHRFPGGKDEIVEAAVELSARRFEAALSPAFTDGDPAERARLVGNGIADYYDDGAESCIIVALSVADAKQRTLVSGCIDAWTEAFKTIAGDGGMSSTQATDAALDAVARLEGALVISATSGNQKPFKRAIASLPEQLGLKRNS